MQTSKADEFDEEFARYREYFIDDLHVLLDHAKKSSKRGRGKA